MTTRRQAEAEGIPGSYLPLTPYAHDPGFQRNTRFRAAATSSTRRTGVALGAFNTICGASRTSLAVSLIAWMKASRLALPSVFVGSILRAPCTMSGKETVGGWNP